MVLSGRFLDSLRSHGTTFIAFTSFPEIHCRLTDHLHAVRRVGLFAFAAAGVANAEDLKIVKRRREALALADLALALFETLIVKLDHRSTRGADEVIVMRVPADVLVVIVVFAEVHTAKTT